MARPRKEGLDYFPHDTDAVADEKIDAMRALYGNDGYAFYFILLERCYSTAAGEFDLSKPAIFASIVKKIMVSKEVFLEMLDTAFDIELFDRQAWEERKVITSNGVRKRVEKVDEERYKNRLKHSKRKASASENPEKTPESKVKKSKVNKNKNNVVVARTRASIQQSMSIYDYWTHCGFGTVSGITAEKLDDMVQQYSEPWLRLAMEEANNQGAHNLAYVRAILERWRSSGGPDQPKNRGKPPDKQRGKGNNGKIESNLGKAAQKAAAIDWEAERENGF